MNRLKQSKVFQALALIAVTSALAHAGNTNWSMGSQNVEGTRAMKDKDLTKETIPQLKKIWTFTAADGAYGNGVLGTPAVVDGVVYAADFLGNVYALDAETNSPTGKMIWQSAPEPAGSRSFTASPLVAGNVVIVGDFYGGVYGFDKKTGKTMWTIRPDLAQNGYPAYPSIWGAATLIKKDLAVIGITGLDEGLPLLGVPCCHTRGALMAFNPETGKIKWQTPTIAPSVPYSRELKLENGAYVESGFDGPAGAGIWSTPTYDKKLNMIYVGTGNNYSQGSKAGQPSTQGMTTQDAIMAFDATSGEIKWVRQMNGTDTFNQAWLFDPATHANADFGDSAHIYTTSAFGIKNQRVVAAGQKSGHFYVLDAKTGKIMNNVDVVPAATVYGGIQATSAYGDAEGLSFVNTTSSYGSAPSDLYGSVNFVNVPMSSQSSVLGEVVAIDGSKVGPDGSKGAVLWRYGLFSPQLQAQAYTNGMVIFQSTSYLAAGVNGSPGSSLIVLNASTGDTLANVPVSNAAMAGPSISNGRIFVGLGNYPYAAPTDDQTGQPAFTQGQITAYGLPPKKDHDDK